MGLRGVSFVSPEDWESHTVLFFTFPQPTTLPLPNFIPICSCLTVDVTKYTFFDVIEFSVLFIGSLVYCQISYFLGVVQSDRLFMGS